MKLDNKYNRRMKKILFVLGAIFLLAVSTAVYSAWQLYATTEFRAEVTSLDTEPIQFTVDFGNIKLDTTHNATKNVSYAELYNANNELDVNVELDIIKSDIEDGCIDYDNDCEVFVYYNTDGESGNTIIIGDEDVITLLSQTYSEFMANVTCIHRSCPGEINVTLSLIG